MITLYYIDYHYLFLTNCTILINRHLLSSVLLKALGSEASISDKLERHNGVRVCRLLSAAVLIRAYML